MNNCIPVAISDTQRIALQALLKDATDAYHNLMTGAAPRVVVDMDGKRVEFATANRGDLNAYILRLQSQLGTCLPGASLTPMRPASFIF